MSPGSQVRVGAALVVVGLVVAVVGVTGVVAGDGDPVAGTAPTTPEQEPATDRASSPPAGGPATTGPTTPEPETGAGEETGPTDGPASPAATPVPTTETVAAFVELFNDAFEEGDAATLLERLHPLVLDVFGEATCRDYLADIVETTPPAIGLREVLPPETWTWEIDGRSVTVADAIPVEVERDLVDQTIIQEVHYARQDGELRWFTDCTP